MQAIPNRLGQITVEKYVCSLCWGQLVLYYDPQDREKSIVLCGRCGEDTKGYVSKYYAEHHRQDNSLDAIMVTRMLENIGIIQRTRPVLTEQELLKSIGF
jgi:DNA-directed RNA polymerase subunit RPC12/RpoP